MNFKEIAKEIGDSLFFTAASVGSGLLAGALAAGKADTLQNLLDFAHHNWVLVTVSTVVAPALRGYVASKKGPPQSGSDSPGPVAGKPSG